MLNIQPLVLGSYQTNCYLVSQAGSSCCCLVDPGYTPEKILAVLEDKGLTLAAILLTHGHFDHVGGVADLVAATGCPVYLCPEDRSLPSALTAGPLPQTLPCREGDVLEAAGVKFTVLHTPGHTPGSVCYLAEDVLFSGDTLFAGSCGRVDLPGGNGQAMAASLQRLAGLENNDLLVLPGHGPASTLGQEKRHNPYLTRTLWN